MEDRNYPWYEAVDNDDIKQGDIFEDVEVFRIADDWVDGVTTEARFEAVERNVIVMSQTCDMSKKHPKVDEVLLCPLYYRWEMTKGHLTSDKGMEDARRNNLPRFLVLAECSLPGLEREIRVVEFAPVFTLPLIHLRKKAESVEKRIRLLPPYREHLSQSFARFFMRVGLPIEIPSFKE